MKRSWASSNTKVSHLINDLAERDLRMMKVREKISSTFRSDQHTAAFANIRSVISTLKKQGKSVLTGIAEMLRSPEKSLALNSGGAE